MVALTRALEVAMPNSKKTQYHTLASALEAALNCYRIMRLNGGQFDAQSSHHFENLLAQCGAMAKSDARLLKASVMTCETSNQLAQLLADAINISSEAGVQQPKIVAAAIINGDVTPLHPKRWGANGEPK